MLNTGMSPLQIELEDAIKNFGISTYHVDDYNEVISKIKNIYVNGDPRAWWLSLKHRKNIASYADDSGYKHVLEIVNANFSNESIDHREVFLIADEDNENMYIYRVPIKSLAYIIENCRYFEYYVVSHDLSWLICENDHGDLIICRS